MHTIAMERVLLFLLILPLPYYIQKVLNRYPWMDSLGSAFWCYLIGLALAQTPLLTIDIKNLLSFMMKITIPIALPLFVFAKASTQKDIHHKAILKSFAWLFISVVICSTIMGYTFHQMDPKSPYYAAMIAGTYIGGTINMAALHQIFALPEQDFLVMNASDTLTGGVYLLLLLSILPKFYSLILNTQINIQEQVTPKDKISFCKKNVLQLLALSTLTVLISYLPTRFFSAYWENMIFFSLLTLIAWLISLKIPKIIAKQSPVMGNYLLMIFCLCIGTQLDLQMINNLPWHVFTLVLATLLGTILLHLLAAKIFHIHRDIFLISHTAGIFGPVFIAPMTNSLKRSDLLISGIGIAVVGNILGNFVGLLVFQILNHLH